MPFSPIFSRITIIWNPCSVPALSYTLELLPIFFSPLSYAIFHLTSVVQSTYTSPKQQPSNMHTQMWSSGQWSVLIRQIAVATKKEPRSFLTICPSFGGQCYSVPMLVGDSRYPIELDESAQAGPDITVITKQQQQQQQQSSSVCVTCNTKIPANISGWRSHDCSGSWKFIFPFENIRILLIGSHENISITWAVVFSRWKLGLGNWLGCLYVRKKNKWLERLVEMRLEYGCRSGWSLTVSQFAKTMYSEGERSIKRRILDLERQDGMTSFNWQITAQFPHQ